ncbi:unnamed protein product [Soboliphyme baturini]|uniref:HECT domain-containing protein n=1 Tax=Soboliphyme baturini TaxID=241478 RepID=A0A183J2T5_9BILA|nr:unnamed protein product [Soboliphyme baturini]
MLNDSRNRAIIVVDVMVFSDPLTIDRIVSAQSLQTSQSVSDELASQANFDQFGSEINHENGAETSREAIDISNLLMTIENDLFRLRLISHDRVEQFFTLLKSDDMLTERQAQVLLQVCGEPLFYLKGNERTEYVDRVWKLLPQHGNGNVLFGCTCLS